MSETYPNAGQNTDLSKYRTGETPMVGDVVRMNQEYIGGIRFCTAPFDSTVTAIRKESVGYLLHATGHEPCYPIRFDLIRRADSPDAGKVVEPASTFNHQSIDAAEWAAEFCRLFGGHDEGLMLGWFANAIMAGYDEVTRRLRQPHETTVDSAVKDSLTPQPAPFFPTLLEAAEAWSKAYHEGNPLQQQLTAANLDKAVARERKALVKIAGECQESGGKE